ncbi:acyltransferase family protein [Cupriavidus basilensis]
MSATQPGAAPAQGRAAARPYGTAMASHAVGTLPALTSIRFLAAVTVVLCHFTEIGVLNGPVWFLQLADGGRPAVSLFFVLSGFVLTFTYRDKIGLPGGAAAFYAARFARIYPVLVLSLLLSLPVTLWLLHTGDSELLREWYGLKGSYVAMLAVSLVAQLLALTAWLPFSALNQPWNGPAWSISCEAFFYALFPLLLRRLEKRGSGALALLCLALWLLQGAWIALLLAVLPPSRHGFLVAQFPLTHLFEFVLGVCAGIAYARLRGAGGSRHALGMGLVAVAVCAVGTLAVLRPLSPAFYLQAPFFGALILGLALLERPVAGVLHRRWLVSLGEASFALYLIHVPLARMAYLAGWRQQAGWLAVALAILLSLAIYRYVEEPMRRQLRRRLAGPRVVLPVVLSVVPPVAPPASAPQAPAVPVQASNG